MSTIQGIIEKVDMLKPNTYSQEIKLEWLNKIEGIIALRIIKSTVYIPYVLPEDISKELLVPFPFDKVYEDYIYTMIDYANNEFNLYNASSTIFNTSLDDYAKWHKENNTPVVINHIKNIW